MSDDPVSDRVTDDELVARIVASDAVALSALFRRRQADVYRVAMLMTGSPAAAEDVTQDVFLAVMNDARRFESGRATVVAWLCGIARNHARRRLQRDSRTRSLSDAADTNEPAMAVLTDPLADLANAAQVEALRRAVLSLPIRYREVVVLCDLQELSYADAAVALDCAVGTVRSRLHRARAFLAGKLRGGADLPDAAVKKITRCLA